MVGLPGGRSAGTNPQIAVEVARLRDEAAAANERLVRERALQDQLDRQLAEARRYATTKGLAARQAERRVAELEHELALAREQIEQLHAMDLARTDRIVAHVEDHHRSLVRSLRRGTTTGRNAFVEANPTLLALRHWLTPADAMLVVDGDALIAALASREASDPARGSVTTDEAQRCAAIAALRTGLGRRASRSAIVFDGSASTDAPGQDPTEAEHEPLVLVTAPGVDIATAVAALVAHHDVRSLVLAHETVAASGLVTASYRLGVDALATALTGGA